jgi:hypothetical protein
MRGNIEWVLSAVLSVILMGVIVGWEYLIESKLTGGSYFVLAFGVPGFILLIWLIPPRHVSESSEGRKRYG